MEQEEAMLKQDSDDEKNKGSGSTPMLSCLCMTMIIMSLTLSVAALWIPWDRWSKLNMEMQTMQDNYHHIELLVNLSRSSVPDTDNSTSNILQRSEALTDLALKFDKDMSESESSLRDLITALTKRLHENEVDFNKLSNNQTSLEEKLTDVEKLYDARMKEEKLAKNRTKVLVRQVQDLNLKMNELHVETGRKKKETENVRKQFDEVFQNFKIIREQVEHLKLNDTEIEDNLLKMVQNKLSEASDIHQKDVSEYQAKQEILFESKQRSLQSSFDNFMEQIQSLIQQSDQDLKLKVSRLNENHQEDVKRLDLVNEKLRDVENAIGKLTEERDLGKTVDGLGVRVNELTDTMNQFVQNVLIIKRLSRMVSGENGLESRIEKLEQTK